MDSGFHMKAATRRGATTFKGLVSAMESNSDGDLSVLIEGAAAGEKEAIDKLYHAIFDELLTRARTIAQRKISDASGASLVSESYLALFRTGSLRLTSSASREAFFSLVSRVMLDILCDRSRKQARRQETQIDIWDEIRCEVEQGLNSNVEAIRNAVERFSRSKIPSKQRRHKLLKLNYFVGLTLKDAAEMLDISVAQAHLDKKMAIAELRVELQGEQS